jgi:lipopolysaccharide/colanic/teichoic acid biosynthesis glycosyltransferase
MTLSFLIPFAIALVAAFMAYQSQEEIVKTFCVIVMTISLLVSFAWAAWLVQILILVASLGGVRYFCYRHACQDAMNPKQE